MKRLMVICLVLAVLMSVSATAFAAPNGFVSSPSENPGPTVEDFDPSDEDCEGWLVVTPYGDKSELPEVLRALLEKAYNSIVNAENLTELNEALAALVANKKIDPANLAVSDLFDIHVAGCDFHEEHVDFDIVLSADALHNFVGLLHMNKDGVWELVEDAQVTQNDEHLMFSVESFSPFAIVVDTTGESPDGPTGESNMVYVYAAAMVTSAVALVVVFVLSRKKKVA